MISHYRKNHKQRDLTYNTQKTNKKRSEKSTLETWSQIFVFDGETDLFFVTCLSGNSRPLQRRKIKTSNHIITVTWFDFANHFSKSLPSGHISYTQTTGDWKRCVWLSYKSHLRLQWGDTCLETVAAVWYHDIPRYTAVKEDIKNTSYPGHKICACKCTNYW